jgi:hypothetical protein
MKSLILVLLIIGLVMIGVGYVKSNMQCPPSRIEYRYVPKSFNEEQQVHTPIMAMSGMSDMFGKEDTWLGSRTG